MSSWDSCYKEKYKRIIGHGLNKQELGKNKILILIGYKILI